jgi:hypothetical protein
MAARTPSRSASYFVRLLELGQFERRPRGGWRFGTRRISDTDRLVASGRAEIVGGRYLQLAPQQTGEAA